jgi:hypothetical protein
MVKHRIYLSEVIVMELVLGIIYMVFCILNIIILLLILAKYITNKINLGNELIKVLENDISLTDNAIKTFLIRHKKILISMKIVTVLVMSFIPIVHVWSLSKLIKY